MGKRRNRKRERQANQRHNALPQVALPDFDEFAIDEFSDEEDLLLAIEMGRRAGATQVATNCGSCQEFVEDQEGGRGTCLHPGSGILSPWTDTPGCPFHQRRRR